MTLELRVEKLAEIDRIRLAIQLIQKGISIWDHHFNKKNQIIYDGIVGAKNIIYFDLIGRCIKESSAFIDQEDGIEHRVGALKKELFNITLLIRDDDWAPPEQVILLLHSAYNLIDYLEGGRRTTQKGELIVYVSINQSIDAMLVEGLETFESINAFISDFEKDK